MSHGRGCVILLALLLSPVLAGCGYTAKEIFPERYQTVAVPAFENRTFYRGVEFDLSEALVKQLEARTPYKVAPPKRADTMLQGTITDVSQNTLSRRDDSGVPQQQEVTVRVDFQWKDLTTGKVVRDRKGFEAVGRYAPTPPVSDRFEVAHHQAVQQLARDIVSTMQADW